MLINNVVVADLRKFLSDAVFINVRDHFATVKRRTSFSLAAGLGDRWIYMIALLKDSALSLSAKQRKLLQDSKPSQLHLSAYEAAIADPNFIATTLKDHLTLPGLAV